MFFLVPAFQPSVCNPVVANDLLLRHMESHYRRVRNAKCMLESVSPYVVNLFVSLIVNS